MKQRFPALLASALLGFLLRQLAIPIPYLLGGIITGFVVRTFLDNSFQWPRAWRGLMLGGSRLRHRQQLHPGHLP
ncbi:hypothetical protein [Acidaminococcus sp.]|uniref:hypothetical protein n=1 Tax=Acidaminococcus sp. TaxID=1872103 RepID=UPI0035217E2C